MVFMPPRHGKLVADSVPVLTTEGWKTHGELKPGDFVFRPDGSPVEVIAVSTPDIASFEVEFSNGAVIKVHPNHEWYVHDRSYREWRVYETKDFVRTTKFGKKKKVFAGGRCLYQLPLISPIQFPERKLAIHPYVLGAWLGDGSSEKPCITHAPDETEVVEAIVANGYSISTVFTHATTGVKTTCFWSSPRMFNELKSYNLIGSKHIPDEYKFSSIQQRLELLAGLIDTDGHVENKTGRVRIATSSQRLAEDIADVVRSFGWHACIYKQQPQLSTSGIQGRKVVYYIGFNPTINIPTKLPRKAINRIDPAKRKIGIVDVRPTKELEKGHCIQVRHPDGLYLVGKQLIPTHNSYIISQHFPAWYFLNYPDDEMILTSYGGDLAWDNSKFARDLIESNPKLFGNLRIDQDTRSAARWKIAGRYGALTAAGVGGPITGRGARIAIIDDPIKYEEAESENVRERAWNWYRRTLRTRLTPDGAIILIMTRTHEDDLAGKLLTTVDKNEEELDSNKQWEVISFPAIAEEDEPLIGRKEGEALSSRYPLSELLAIKNELGPYHWNALYQQRPRPEKGDYFQKDWICRFSIHKLPPRMVYFSAMDLAIGEKKQSCYNVLITAGVYANEIFIVDVDRFRGNSEDIASRILRNYVKWRPVSIGIEDGQIRKAIWPSVSRKMREQNIFPSFVFLTPMSDKLLRARTIQSRMRNLNVYFPEEKTVPWVDELVEELLAFPKGRYDDQVDALAWLGLMLGKERPRASLDIRKIAV